MVNETNEMNHISAILNWACRTKLPWVQEPQKNRPIYNEVKFPSVDFSSIFSFLDREKRVINQSVYQSINQSIYQSINQS